jgi:hypothetical protein
MTNVEYRGKSEGSNDEAIEANFSTFGFRHFFVIRHSCFIIGAIRLRAGAGVRAGRDE